MPWGICLLLCALPAAAGARFTAPPKAVADGANVRVTFAVSAATDVEVAVLNAVGRIVRHLAAGKLGPNAPAPLEADTLRQTLTWDRKDDDGKPVAAPCSIRVRLGLGAKLERIIGAAGARLVAPVVGLGVGPGGNVYVLANRDKSGGAFLYVLDGEGNYLRTILPSPAALTDAQLEGLPRVRLADGSRVPLVYQPYTPDFAPYLSGIRSQQLVVTKQGRVVFASGGNNWTDQSVPRHALVLNADGSTPPGVGFVGPKLGRHGRYSIGLPQQQLAAAPDGRTFYFVGMGTAKTKRRPAKGLHCVGRLRLTDGKGPEPFIGTPDEPGDDAKHLDTPVSVATDAAGNLYVADAGNGRVAAFDASGKPLGETKVERPRMVCVHGSGAMYVLTRPAGPRWGKCALIKFDKAVGGKPVARLDLVARNPVVAIDPSATPAKLWLSCRTAWRVPPQLRPVFDRGTKLEPGENALAPAAGAQFSSPLYLAVDAQRDRLYVADFSRRILRVDLKTDKVRPFLTASEVVTDRAGNLYALSGYNTNALLRFDPDGKPLPFAATGSHKLTVQYRAGLPHVGTRGLTVAPGGDIYVFQDNNMRGPERVQVFGPDGRMTREALIRDIPYDSGNSIAVDRAGNVYAGINVHDPKRLYPEAFTGVVPPLAWYMMYTKRSSWYAWPQRDIPPAPWNRMYMNFYLYHIGSVFKFPPAGGRFWIGGKPKPGANPRPADVPATATELRAGYLKTVVWGAGFLWESRGFALNPNRTESWGDPACSCMTSRFCMDEHERLFVPDCFRFSIGVLDTNGNEIMRFGEYGGVDDVGGRGGPAIPFGWPNAVAVAGDRAYVADRKNRRIVVVRLTRQAEATAAVP
jgi:sugar lactone lactonase YvrE